MNERPCIDAVNVLRVIDRCYRMAWIGDGNRISGVQLAQFLLRRNELTMVADLLNRPPRLG